MMKLDCDGCDSGSKECREVVLGPMVRSGGVCSQAVGFVLMCFPGILLQSP
jgi:hypothetical protein